MPATTTPKKNKKPSPSFVTGVIAFVFLIAEERNIQFLAGFGFELLTLNVYDSVHC